MFDTENDETEDDTFGERHEIVNLSDKLESGTEKITEEEEIDSVISLPIEEIKEETEIPMVEKIFRHIMWSFQKDKYEAEDSIPLEEIRKIEIMSLSIFTLLVILVFALIFLLLLKKRKKRDCE